MKLSVWGNRELTPVYPPVRPDSFVGSPGKNLEKTLVYRHLMGSQSERATISGCSLHSTEVGLIHNGVLLASYP